MGVGDSKIKEVFNKFDKDHSGMLTLDNLLTIQNIPGLEHPVTHSPILLYKFDEKQTGTINYEEFKRLVNEAKEVQEMKSDQVHQHAIDLESLGSDMDGPIPMITTPKGMSVDPHTLESLAAAGPPGLGGDGGEGKGAAEGSKEENFIANALKSEVRLPRTEDEKKKFHNWLFKLANPKEQKRISEKELRTLLKALENDGITPDELVMKPSADVETNAKEIIEEYGSPDNPEQPGSVGHDGNVGYLTEDQFLALARCITDNYELTSLVSETVGKYKLREKIGEGSSGVVRVGVDPEGHRKAIKIVNKGDAADMSRLDVEIKAMTLLRHKHIVSLDEVIETENQVYFIMELLEGGSLAEHAQIEPFKNDVARRFFYQILHGVYYCHSHHVYHRDLKLENVLLAADGFTVKVCDFGHAGISVGDWDIFSTSLVGSLFHISPEQMQNQCYSGEKVDIWALGVLLYRMLVGRPPFMAENGHDLMEKVTSGTFPEPEGINPRAVDLIHRILQPDPEARPSIAEIVKHPWIRAEAEMSVIPSLLAFSFSVNCIYINKTRTLQLLKEILSEHKIRYRTHQRGSITTIECRYSAQRLRFTISVCNKDVYPTFISESGILPPTPEIDTQQAKQQQQQQPTQPTPSTQPSSSTQSTQPTQPTQPPPPSQSPSISQLASQPPQSPQSPQSALNLKNQHTHSMTNLTTVPAIAGAATGIEMDNSLYESQEESEHISVETIITFTFSFNSGSGVKYRGVAREIQRKITKKLLDSALVKPDLPLGKDIMLMTAERIAEEFRTAFQEDLNKIMPTVLLLGKTGCGKSSVANKVFRLEVAKVGQGKPVTMCFEKYWRPEASSIAVYDSKGFEVNSANEFKDEMDSYFEKCGDTVHVIWYLVDGTSSRFEPFEQELLMSSPLGAPVIVLVNKADLCAAADIDALRAAVEAASIPCVKGVIATTAAAETVGQPPESCPECGSDDISELRKKLQWRCNGCGILRDLERKSPTYEGLDKVITLTNGLLPDKAKEKFVGSQYVSIGSKLGKSFEIITDVFLRGSNPNEMVITRNVIKVMTRICKLWDIYAPVKKDDAQQSGGSSGADGAAVPPSGVMENQSDDLQIADYQETTPFMQLFLTMLTPSYNANSSNNNGNGKQQPQQAHEDDDSDDDDDEFDEDKPEDDNYFDWTFMEKVMDVMGTSASSINKDEGDESSTVGDQREQNEQKKKVRMVMSLTIVWTMSLMSLFLLLVDHGFDATTMADGSQKSPHIINGCVDRAFVYFNVEKVQQVEKSIRENGTYEAFIQFARFVLRNTFPKLKTKKYDEESILKGVRFEYGSEKTFTKTNALPEAKKESEAK